MATLFQSFTIFLSLSILFSAVHARFPTTSPEKPSATNIEVKIQQKPNPSGKFSDEFLPMPASGSFPGKLVTNRRPIDRMRVVRRSFPLNCFNRRPKSEGGAQIRQRRSEEELRLGRRYGKIVSARWIDGTTFHRLDAVTIPDFVDGDGFVVGEFRHPRFVFRRRQHHRNEGIGRVLWRKIRDFLIKL